MRCPADRSLLSAHQHRQLSFAACSSCHGLWFDRPTTLATESVEGLKPPYTEGPLDARSWVGWERRCVACHIGLVSERVGGVEIDRCPACGGLWLDAGELPAVAAWYRREQAGAGQEGPTTGPHESAANRTTVADVAGVVGEGLGQAAVEGVVEGTVWLAEGVVKFVFLCAEGLLDGL